MDATGAVLLITLWALAMVALVAGAAAAQYLRDRRTTEAGNFLLGQPPGGAR